jgi:hypothetical protein
MRRQSMVGDDKGSRDDLFVLLWRYAWTGQGDVSPTLSGCDSWLTVAKEERGIEIGKIDWFETAHSSEYEDMVDIGKYDVRLPVHQPH